MNDAEVRKQIEAAVSKTAEQAEAEAPDERPHIPLATWLVVAVVTFANFAGTYLAIAPAVGAYTVSAVLKAPEKRIWIITAQSIPSIVTSPVLGVVTDCKFTCLFVPSRSLNS